MVILHDCEVIEDTPNGRRVLKEFLKAHKQLTILATSRRAFNLGTKLEHARKLRTLKVPNDYDLDKLSFEDLQTYEAIELFRQAAEENDEKFTLTEQNIKTVAAICQALKGLPLALLIAAAWVKHEPIDRVYKWIVENGLLNAHYNRTDVEWHQSLYLLIEKSYLLLGEKEQRLFRRLAVFTGTCGGKAVAEICNLDKDISTDEDELLSHLTTLHDNYLITYEDRIEITHNTIKAYALRKLGEKKQKWAEGEEEKLIRRRHRDFFLANAQTFFPDFLENHPQFSGRPEVLRKNRLPENSDAQRATMIFIRFEQMVNNWLEEYPPEYAKQMKDGTFLPIIQSPAMEAALTDHNHFYDAMEWTFREEGVDGWEAFGYLEHTWHMPDHYADLCLQWMGLWVLEFGTQASYTGVEERC